MDDLQKYFYINIRGCFEQEGSNEIGEADLQEAISDFTCVTIKIKEVSQNHQ